ncbi:hypothetical protein T4D_1342, partial [Trichinella pseudospiralis]
CYTLKRTNRNVNIRCVRRGHKSVVAPSTNLEATRVISISVGPGSEYDVQQLGLEISAPSSNSAETASHCRANANCPYNEHISSVLSKVGS